jgi:hypothetical protein
MTPKSGVSYSWAARRYVLLSPMAVPLEALASALPPDQARWTLSGLRDRRGALIVLLVETGEGIRSWRHLGDDDVLLQIARRIAGRRLVVLPEEALEGTGEGSGRAASAEIQIVRAVMGDERQLRFQEQQLVLLQVNSWPWLRDELDLQVIPRDEAGPMLDQMARAAASTPDRQQALTDAKGLLIDRIVPGTTDGLVLARRAPGRSYRETPEDVIAAPAPKPVPDEEPPPLTIVLQHLYHDDGPIQGAEYVLTFPGGQVIKGKLDSAGMATVSDVPEETADVVYGPDSRDYKPVEQPKNPAFKASLSPAQADATAEKYWRESGDDDGDGPGGGDGDAGDSSDDGSDDA